MKKNYQYLLFATILLLISLTGVGILSFYDYQKKELPKKQEVKEIEKEEVIIPYTNEMPNFRTQYSNDNIKARIEVPGVGINSLVTRTNDNSFYLTKNYYNQTDGLGVPFFDYRNVNLEAAKQLNIYGHNTENNQFKDRLPFIKLLSFKDKNIFNTKKDIYLYTDIKKIEYEVVAIKITTKDDITHMQVNFQDSNDFLNHMNRLLQNTYYKDDFLVVDENDHFLVLQVCNYEPADTILLVIAKAKT